MGFLTPDKYRELFKLRAKGKLDDMECTKNLYKIIKPIIEKGDWVLDVGCGVGHYYRLLQRLGNINYMGIDLDKKAIDLANKIWRYKRKTHFYHMNSENTVFYDDRFHIVFAHNLILHLPDYKKTLKEMFRLSNRYIIIRSLFDEKTKKKKVMMHPDYSDVYKEGVAYYNTYSRKEIREFIKSLGKCKINFIPDNAEIPEKSLKKQEKVLKVDSKEFTRGKQKWKGLKLNYEVLLIEKL